MLPSICVDLITKICSSGVAINYEVSIFINEDKLRGIAGEIKHYLTTNRKLLTFNDFNDVYGVVYSEILAHSQERISIQ